MESDAHRVGIAGFIYLVKHCCLTNFKSDWLANVFFSSSLKRNSKGLNSERVVLYERDIL